MGQDESKAFEQNPMITGDVSVPSSYIRMNSDRQADTATISSTIGTSTITQPIHDAGMAGKWSLLFAKGRHPTARLGHFTVYSKETNKMYVGYGSNGEGLYYNDCWVLDLNTNSWSELQLSGDIVSPRTGSRAVLVGTNIIVIGGFSEPTYFEDLHCINTLTGVVTSIETSGENPGPRSTPIIHFYNKKLMVWGGFNGKWCTSLHILDTASSVWSSSEPGLSGRTAIPYAVSGNKCYGYGCSRSGGFVVLDPDTETVSILRSDGTAPPSETMNAGMVTVGEYIFYFGGKTDQEYTNIYGYCPKRNWWFILPVVPDGETVSFADGSISESGIFMIPKIYNFSVVYDEYNRQIVVSLGFPHQEFPTLSILDMSEALGVMHLRDDLLETLHFE